MFLSLAGLSSKVFKLSSILLPYISRNSMSLKQCIAFDCKFRNNPKCMRCVYRQISIGAMTGAIIPFVMVIIMYIMGWVH